MTKAVTVALKTGEKTIVPKIQLVPGDIIEDDQLNLLDYNAILSCFGSRRCEKKVQSDLNFDKIVDEVDLNILYSAYRIHQRD